MITAMASRILASNGAWNSGRAHSPPMKSRAKTPCSENITDGKTSQCSMFSREFRRSAGTLSNPMTNSGMPVVTRLAARNQTRLRRALSRRYPPSSTGKIFVDAATPIQAPVAAIRPRSNACHPAAIITARRIDHCPFSRL